MKSLFFGALVVALAAPAVAQDAMSTPSQTPATESQTASEPMPAPAAPAAATPSDPASILKNEFPVYDKDGNGELSKIEFSSWLTALKAAAPQKTAMTPDQESKWLDKSFVDADADKTKSVNLAELTTYLTKKS
jgi:Ca2+-binding EF-hand superfamily protein